MDWENHKVEHQRLQLVMAYIKKEEAFHEYGLPMRVRSDNGPPFGCVGAGRLTRLSINLIKAGVTPEWIRFQPMPGLG